MPIIVLVAIIILAEKITQKNALDLSMLVLKKIWSLFEGFILFLLRMNEPPGSKS